MSLWEFLTKERGLGNAAFRWNEPSLYRVRLRGDLLTRLAVVVACWIAATGVLLVLFAFNQRPPGIPLAFGLGLVFGMGPAALLCLLGRDHVAGRVRIDGDGIHRQRSYASFSSQWSEWSSWPFDSISKGVIVPAPIVEHSFALLLLSVEQERDVIAIPSRVDIKSVASHLSAHGVSVSLGKTVPRDLRTPMNLMTPVIFGGVALFLFAGGLTIWLIRTGRL